MTTENILQLPTTVALDGSEQIEIVQNGTSKQSTTGAVAGLVNLYPTTPGGYVLGNNTASPAVAAFHSLSSTMDIPLGSAIGNLPVRGASNWGALSPGTIGQVLRTGGVGALPFWSPGTGTGSVYQINPGTNISMSPSPIVDTGTISTVANPVFATSTTTPIVYGGTTAASTLTLQSTSGVGTADSISFKTGNNGAVTALALSTIGKAQFGASSITATANQGAIGYGTLSYSDTNVLESLQTSVNSYAQLILQNTSNGASASADITISNDTGTASANYANFGINSSGFSGTGSFSQPNNVYLTSASSDIVIGTLSSNYIRFVVNNGATDAMTISPTGVVTIPNADVVQTSLTTPIVYGGTTASSTLTLQSTSGVGTTDSIALKVGNNGAVTALSLSTTGAATFANSVAATTVAATTSVTTPTVYGGSSTSQALTFQSTTGVGATDSILFKVGNNGAVTSLSLASSGAATFANTVSAPTSVTSPSIYGGSSTSQTLTFQSTTGVGATDSIQFKVGNNGAVTALSLSTTGAATFANSVAATTVSASTSVTTPTIYGGSSTSQALTFQSTTGVGATDSIVFKVGNAGATTAFTIGTGTAASLTFAGTAQRFLADFDNATVLNRFAFATKTLNASTGIYALPNGSSTAASWQATNAADPTNASKILIATNGSTDVQLVSGVNGSGSYLPLAFYNGGSSRMTVSSAGNVNVASGTYENANTIASYTIPNGSNAVSSGPISITGTFVISTGSSWTCV